MDYSSQPVTFTLGQSSTGRWGYRSGNTKLGVVFTDSESGEVKELPKAVTYRLGADTRGDETIPDGISLDIEFADMSYSDFVEAFTEAYGYAPPKKMNYLGVDAEGEHIWEQG
jgi:hypothetical protein